MKLLLIVVSVVPVALPSRKMTLWPGWIVVSPRSATEVLADAELSSILHPEIFTGTPPV
jgi:hypothetical protein